MNTLLDTVTVVYFQSSQKQIAVFKVSKQAQLKHTAGSWQVSQAQEPI